MGYVDALIVDLVTVAVVLALMVRHGRLAHAHPATVYLFFHLYAFTWRLGALALGSPPLFADPSWPQWVVPLQEPEIVRASLLADGALVAMTLAWLRAAHVYGRRPAPGQRAPPGQRLSPRVVRWVSAIALPIGVAGMLLLARLPGVRIGVDPSATGEWSTSAYLLIIQAWPGLVLVALIYVYGFRWWLLLPAAAFLLVMGYQGFARFRMVIPALLLAQIYLDRRRWRWPTPRVAALLLAVALAFYPLKLVARALHEGTSMDDVLALASGSLERVAYGEAPDQMFLDQWATFLDLTDRSEALTLGRPYLAFLTLPIPRQLWPEKPALNEHIVRLDDPTRPAIPAGMVMTILGDLYLNFSYAGLFLVAPLLAYGLARVYFAATRRGFGTVGHFAYLLVASNLLLVYRDGLISLAVFTFVNMMPLAVIVLLHLIGRRGASSASRITRALPRQP